MNKLFVPYKIALALKELGFNERCLSRFPKITTEYAIRDNLDVNECLLIGGYKPVDIPGPLYQQVIDWFREKHDIHIIIDYYYDGTKWRYKIDYINSIIYDDVEMDGFQSYYKALNSAINKVIELIKTKTQ